MKTSVKHLGIIMDGNGRWATLRRRDRFWGHLRGAQIAHNTIEECSRLGIKVLTLYAFSTENWYRPREEVRFLMHLLKRQLIRKRQKLIKNNIKFQIIGEMDRLPDYAQEEIRNTIEATKDNTGMTLVFALSYGSRQELVNACKDIAKKVRAGELDAEDIDQDLVSNCLDTRQYPDPDLILRTSGEYRLSNFMMWQAAYSEIVISDTLWPDFTTDELHNVLATFEGRERRFGRVSSRSVAISSEVSSNTLNH